MRPHPQHPPTVRPWMCTMLLHDDVYDVAEDRDPGLDMAQDDTDDSGSGFAQIAPIIIATCGVLLFLVAAFAIGRRHCNGRKPTPQPAARNRMGSVTSFSSRSSKGSLASTPSRFNQFNRVDSSFPGFVQPTASNFDHYDEIGSVIRMESEAPVHPYGLYEQIE